jgi:putative ABC transport system permease protein
MIWETTAPPQQKQVSFSYPDFADCRERIQSFEAMGASMGGSFTITGSGETDLLRGVRVTPNFFSLLGVDLAMGRPFLLEEERPGNDAVVVISHRLWRDRFGGRQDALNQQITLNDRSYTIIGIMQPEVAYPPWWVEGADVFVPLTPGSERRNRSLTVVGRLKPGFTLSQTQAEVNEIALALQRQYQDTNKGMGFKVISLEDQLVGKVRSTLLVFLWASGFVLLIACANITGLLLIRAAARQKEIAIRLVVGSGRRRLVRQLLTETIVLATIGGALGMLALSLTIKILVNLLPEDLPRIKSVSIDGRVLAFGLLLSILTGIIFGLAPALQATKPDLNAILKGSRKGLRAVVIRGFAGNLLVIAQVALTVVLLIGAGLMIRSFIRLQNVNIGIKPDNVMTMWVSLPRARYPQPDQHTAFFEQVLNRVKSIPDAKEAALVNVLPLSGQNESLSFRVEGNQETNPNEAMSADYRPISSEYFEVMGIPVIKGRPFSEQDNKTSPGVVIINDTLARRISPNENVLGRRLTIMPEKTAREIIGVVGDIKHRGPDANYFPEMYVPYLQRPSESLYLVARSARTSTGMTNSLRNAIWSVDRNLPILDVKSMNQIVSDSVAPNRFYTFLLTAFATIALILAIIGVYGVISYTVHSQTREIGIRMALGAQPGRVFYEILRRGALLIVIGEVIGVIAAVALSRVLATYLLGMVNTDAITLIVVLVILGIVGLLACLIPARRALRIDPVIALRVE